MPERDVRRPCQEGATAVDERLNVRLLHVWPQEDLLTWPMLNEGEARWVACVLKHGDAPAVWLDGLDRGDELSNRVLGRGDMLGKGMIADENHCSAHTDSK